MRKRGQLSIFMIAGVLVVIAVSLFLYAQSPGSLPLETPARFAPVANALRACMHATVEDAVHQQLVSGGVLHPINPVLLLSAYASLMAS